VRKRASYGGVTRWDAQAVGQQVPSDEKPAPILSTAFGWVPLQPLQPQPPPTGEEVVGRGDFDCVIGLVC
jgi:hypothetical protein